MRILIACEFSGIVREAFAKRGHDAWSCDLLPTEIPGQHIQGDVLEILDNGWDMMIGHPPCTYMSNAGARHMYPGGVLNQERLNLALEAKQFFMELAQSRIEMVAIENPRPLKVVGLPPHSQVIQPYFFGDPYSKATYLWLKKLPPLLFTNIESEFRTYLPSNTGGKKRGQKATMGVAKTWKERSRTFQGIANAMAAQWG